MGISAFWPTLPCCDVHHAPSGVAPRWLAILGSRGFPSRYGGFEAFVRDLAPAWASAGHEVSVYCRRRDSSRLVLNVANGYFLPALRARLIPTVLNTDGLEWTRGKWGPAAKRVFYTGAKLSTRWADVLVADSIALGESWHSEFGRRPRFIPYGAEATPAVSADRILELGLRPRSYVLVLARLVPENDGSPMEQRLAALDRSGRLRWLGHVRDQALLSALRSHARTYIHGHSVGGTNPGLLEALAAGPPTLALATPFNREVLEHAGQLFSANDDELAARIRQVLPTPALQEEISRRGQTIVRTRYSWNSVVQEYIAAVRDAIRLAGKR